MSLEVRIIYWTYLTPAAYTLRAHVLLIFSLAKLQPADSMLFCYWLIVTGCSLRISQLQSYITYHTRTYVRISNLYVGSPAVTMHGNYHRRPSHTAVRMPLCRLLQAPPIWTRHSRISASTPCYVLQSICIYISYNESQSFRAMQTLTCSHQHHYN